MLGALLASHFLWPANAAIHRYDALTLYAIAIQAVMLAVRLETLREAVVILVFHAVGTVMELFKTAVGSWIYPEPSLLHVGHVSLFSGFTYASVGSYIARVWHGFDFRFSHYPWRSLMVALAAAIYLNFFAHHWAIDMRWGLFAATALIFSRNPGLPARELPVDATPSWLLPGRAVHLVRGEYRYLRPRLGLPQPDGGLAFRFARQVR